ncbi:MAG: cupin domain-containing protein [Elusimicrobiota bacterium]
MPARKDLRLRILLLGAGLAALGAVWARTAADPAPLGHGLFIGTVKDSEWKPSTNLPPGSEYHLLREDPDTQGIQAIVRFPAGYAVPEHTHACDETFVVLKGKLWVKAGELEEVLGPGGYAVLPAGVPHELKAKTRWGKTSFLATTNAPYSLKYTGSR